MAETLNAKHQVDEDKTGKKVHRIIILAVLFVILLIVSLSVSIFIMLCIKLTKNTQYRYSMASLIDKCADICSEMITSLLQNLILTSNIIPVDIRYDSTAAFLMP